MFDSLVYLFDTRKSSGSILVPLFVARLVVVVGRRFGRAFDFGSYADTVVGF